MSRFGNMVRGKKAPQPAPVPEVVVEELPVVEEVVVETPEIETTEYEPLSLEEMSKDELEQYGREIGIELDKRHSKGRLINEILEHLDN